MTGFCKLVAANREQSYSVRLASGISEGNVAELAQAIGGRKSLLVTSPTVARLYANNVTHRLIQSGVDVSLAILECTERSKTLVEVERVCQACFRAGMDRRSLLVGFGGGVCTDVVTMAAALTRRGLSYLRIPTTLIGLIDAGIGIKGAVNLPDKKSAMGIFYPPEQVLLDPGFLKTLPGELVAEGLAEAIKVGVTLDPILFAFLEQFSGELLGCTPMVDTSKLTEVVWRSTLRLLEELETNLYEDKTYRRVLDFGHTFSPLLESMSNFRVSHGVAVAIDIALSTSVAFELNLLSLENRNRILGSLRHARLPIYSPLLTTDSCVKALEESEAHRGGHLNLVLPSGIGSAVFVSEKSSLPLSVLDRAVRFLDQEARRHRFQQSHGSVYHASGLTKLGQRVQEQTLFGKAG